MYLNEPEDFRTVYIDPGEATGWCTGCGPRLLSAGTTPMWEFADDLWRGINSGEGPLGHDEEALVLRRKGVKTAHFMKPIGRVVMEDFRIYPDKAKALIWDPVRTLRLIGAITFICRVSEIDLHLQPAAIKSRAQAGGAEEYYYRPLHENRHQNDAIQHFVYFSQLGPDGDPRTPNQGVIQP